MGYAEIIGTGFHVPERVVPTSDFEGQTLYHIDANGEVVHVDEKGNVVAKDAGVPKSVVVSSEWIHKNMGARERRYVSEDEYVHHIAAKAGQKALDDAGIKADQLEGILVPTISQQFRFPSVAALVQDILGAKNVRHADDPHAACSGYNVALYQASQIVSQRPGSYYLVIGAETLSLQERANDINKVLFGDGAGAAVLAYTQERKGIVASYLKSDPFGGRAMLISDGGNSQLLMHDGNAVYMEAIPSMVHAAQEVMNEAGWDPKDVFLIPHQANIRIIRAVGQKLGLSSDQVFVNIDRYGNMSSATYAVGLAEAREQGLVHEGSKVVLTSIGSGLITAANAILF